MHRLFVALRPPREIRSLLTASMGGVPGARWQADDQLHLTLRFIGEVDRRAAEDIALALGDVRAGAPELAISGVGAFDRRGRVEALWAGVTPHDSLAALHRKVDHVVIGLGLPPERRAYLPHITLARLARGAAANLAVERWRIDHAGLTSAAFGIGHFTLFESRLGDGGARYETIARWPLIPARD